MPETITPTEISNRQTLIAALRAQQHHRCLAWMKLKREVQSKQAALDALENSSEISALKLRMMVRLRRAISRREDKMVEHLSQAKRCDMTLERYVIMEEVREAEEADERERVI